MAVKTKNPFRTKNGEPVQAITARLDKKGRMTKTGSALVSESGEFNASNRKDLINGIQSYGELLKAGEIRKYYVSKEETEEKLNLFSEAFHDPSGTKMMSLGEDVSDVIQDHILREGLSRKFLPERELARGEPARIRFRTNKAGAVVMGVGGYKPYQQAWSEQYQNAPEYYVNGYVLIEDKDIAQATGDLLSERLEDAQEQVQVAEDTRSRNLLEFAAMTSGQQIFFNSFTPQFYQSLRNMINTRGINCQTVIMAGDLWNDILTHPDFVNYFDPITQHTAVQNGLLGNFLGVDIVTDAYIANDRLRVLQPGECFFCAHRKYLGQLMVREQLRSVPIDQYNLGRPVRGWMLISIEAAFISNVNGVARGIKY